jgi:RNA polymerase sigma factor (TIGR02999 family)
MKSPEITVLLRAWANGDAAALEKLTPLVYDELYRRAAACMRDEHRAVTFQPTALVNEAWLRLAAIDGLALESRLQFFAISATMMRRILVDAARRRRSEKHGGPFTLIPLGDSPEPAIATDRELVALDEALVALAREDPRKARVIELRYFAGLSVEETAAVLKVSPQSVMRDWKLSRAWIMREMRESVC